MTQPSLLDAPISKRSFTEAMAMHFRRHPSHWIDGDAFRLYGGKYAYRTRISDCRTKLGMNIQNRQRRIKRADGSQFVISEYRFLPAESSAVAS